TLWSYEVGGQYRSDDRRLRAEVAVYYNDWKNVQSLAFATGFPVQYIVNGSNVAGAGVDVSVDWRATSNLTLSFSGGYNEMAYRNTTGEHIKGDRPDYVPRYSASVSADYGFDWTSGVPGFVRLDFQVVDGWQVFARNILPAAAIAQTQHNLNARVGADLKGLKLSVFAKNLLDENKVVYPAFASLQTPMRQQPRTIGLSAAYDF
ncbi:MAG: TonB-dependent receptor, partial [Proteobacteria bacterium]|nr:TonB-dependent receptor [Pseudomonadota bacterium]